MSPGRKYLMVPKAGLGLTMIELMVTVALASVMVAAVYYIYNNSAVGYRVENEVMDMESRMRFSLEHLKRDVKRAGFLATPNSTVDDAVCPKPNNQLRAVTVTPGDGWVYQPFGNANPNISPASITLFGDFWSGRVYRTASIVENKVYLQGDAVFPASETEFERIFSTSRYLRIVNKDRFELYLPIVSSDYAQRVIQLNQTVPSLSAGSLCGIAGFGEGLEVNVAGFIKYSVVQDTREKAPDGKADLVRQDVGIDGTTVLDGTRLPVGEYVVDMQFYDFAFDSDTTGENPEITLRPFIEDVSGGGSWRIDNVAAARPEDLRAISVKLTMRSVDEDPSSPHTARTAAHTPLMTFELSLMAGTARCLSLGGRLVMDSLLARNVKGAGP